MHTMPISDNYFVTLFNALSPQFHEYSNKTINDEQKGRLKLLVTTRKKVLVILRSSAQILLFLGILFH